MVHGKLGLTLAVGMLVLLPVEKWQLFGLGPTDAFIVLMILLAWPVFWRSRMRVKVPLALAMCVIFVGSFIGALSGQGAFTALLALLQEVYLFVMFVTLANAFADEKTFLTFRKAWVIVGAVESALLLLGRFGIVLPGFGGGSGAELKFGASAADADALLAEYGRALGTFVNANAASGYMLVSFFVLLATPYPRNRLLRAALIVLYLGGVVSTGSNSGLAGVAVGLTLAVLYWQYHRGRALLLTLGLGTLAASALLVVVLSWSSILPVIISTFGRVQQGDALYAFTMLSQKLSKREAIWGPGLKVFQEHPLGIGPNVSKTAVGIGMHNDYVAFLVERGPLGLLGLILLIVEMLAWLARASRNGTGWSHHWATGAMLGGLAGVLTLAAFHEVSHGRPVWLLFAMIILHARFLGAEVGARERIVPARTQPGLATS